MKRKASFKNMYQMQKSEPQYHQPLYQNNIYRKFRTRKQAEGTHEDAINKIHNVKSSIG